jgi:hypothetical protein
LRTASRKAWLAFHQIPAVRDLDRFGERLLRRQRIAAAAVPSHDGDLRLVRQPRFGSRRFSIRQQRNRLSALEITDQRSIAMVASPSPVVDPDDRRRREARTAAPPHGAQQGVVADRHAQAARKTRRRSASKGKRETMDDLIEPSCAPRRRLENVFAEAFCEDAPPTQNRLTAEAPRFEREHHPSPSDRQIREASMVSTVNPRRNYATRLAWAACARRANRHGGAVFVAQRAIRGKPRWDQF